MKYGLHLKIEYMKKIVNEYKKIRAGNIVTTNLLYILDKKGISNSNDKIKDYAKYLDERTNIRCQSWRIT